MNALFRFVMGGLALCSTFAFAAPTSSGSVTINGKTFSLAHARARSSGSMFGVPTIDVFVAEKDLADVKGSPSTTNGDHGVLLHFDCTPVFTNGAKSTDKIIHYRATVELQMDWPFMHWQSRQIADSRDPALQASDLSVSEGVVSGKLAWKGSNVLDAATDTPTTLTAWSAQFQVPLEPKEK